MKSAIAKIPAVRDGEVFSVGGVEFIKFPEMSGAIPAVSRNILFHSRFGDDNDLRNSDVMERLEADFLPKIVEAVGAENLSTIKTDLTALDGLNTYGIMESVVSLPTLDFYRKNVQIFDAHPVKSWWWIATPESAAPHSEPWWVACVAPSGYVNFGNYYGGSNGVRPFLSFKSSIFESSEE